MHLCFGVWYELVQNRVRGGGMQKLFTVYIVDLLNVRTILFKGMIICRAV